MDAFLGTGWKKRRTGTALMGKAGWGAAQDRDHVTPFLKPVTDVPKQPGQH